MYITTELPQLAVLSFTHWLILAICIVILEHFQHIVFSELVYLDRDTVLFSVVPCLQSESSGTMHSTLMFDN